MRRIKGGRCLEEHFMPPLGRIRTLAKTLGTIFRIRKKTETRNGNKRGQPADGWKSSGAHMGNGPFSQAENTPCSGLLGIEAFRTLERLFFVFFPTVCLGGQNYFFVFSFFMSQLLCY